MLSYWIRNWRLVSFILYVHLFYFDRTRLECCLLKFPPNHIIVGTIRNTALPTAELFKNGSFGRLIVNVTILAKWGTESEVVEISVINRWMIFRLATDCGLWALFLTTTKISPSYWNKDIICLVKEATTELVAGTLKGLSCGVWDVCFWSWGGR